MVKIVVLIAGIALGAFFKGGKAEQPKLPIIEEAPVATEVKNPNPKERSFKPQLRTLVQNSATTVFLIGRVDRDSATAVISELKAKDGNNKRIILAIDSPGGSVFDGAQIISTIEGMKAKVDTLCLGLCASMAFVIHQYGDERMMVDRSMLMAHPASGGSMGGQVDNMKSLLTTVTRYIHKMDMHIARRAGLTFDEYQRMFAFEMWIDAEDATAQKFNDSLVYIPNLVPLTAPSLEPEGVSQQLRSFVR